MQVMNLTGLKQFEGQPWQVVDLGVERRLSGRWFSCLQNFLSWNKKNFNKPRRVFESEILSKKSSMNLRCIIV